MEHRLFSDATPTAEVMVLNYIICQHSVKLKWLGRTQLWFVSRYYLGITKIMKNIKTVNTQTNTNMGVLWLEPPCTIDGTEWEITWNQLQSIKGTIPVQKYYYKNSLHLYHNIILEVLEQSRLHNKTSLHNIRDYLCACIKMTLLLYPNTWPQRHIKTKVHHFLISAVNDDLSVPFYVQLYQLEKTGGYTGSRTVLTLTMTKKKTLKIYAQLHIFITLMPNGRMLYILPQRKSPLLIIYKVKWTQNATNCMFIESFSILNSLYTLFPLSWNKIIRYFKTMLL